MKTCSQCKQKLPLDAFDLQSTGKLGRRADCKICRKRFTRSKQGLVKEMLAFQKSKSKKRGYAPPSYTEDELYAWAMGQPDFHELYDAWVESGFQSRFKPSCDRKNDYISYTLDNIQILTWNENNQKGYASQFQGSNTKKSHAVDMLDLTGNFLQRFSSVSEAARQFNGIPSNIIGAIRHRTSKKKNPDGSIRMITVTTAYGYKWRYSSVPNDNSEIV